MVREVDLVSYLPPFMQKYKELAAALESEDPEFTTAWNEVDRILYNHFITTADESGISRFETIMKISPLDTDSLELRRARVQSRWTNFVPYTMRVLTYKVAELLGEEHKFSIQPDFENTYKMELVIYSTDESLTNELLHLLKIMVPLNIVTEIIYEPVTSVATICLGAFMEQADIIEINQR